MGRILVISRHHKITKGTLKGHKKLDAHRRPYLFVGDLVAALADAGESIRRLVGGEKLFFGVMIGGVFGGVAIGGVLVGVGVPNKSNGGVDCPSFLEADGGRAVDPS